MRPGEKLFEELYYHGEESLKTDHEQILSSTSRGFEFDEVESQVNQLIEKRISISFRDSRFDGGVHSRIYFSGKGCEADSNSICAIKLVNQSSGMKGLDCQVNHP